MRSTTRRTSGTMTIAVEVLAEESSARIGFATGDDDIRINVNQGLEVDFLVSSKRCLFLVSLFSDFICVVLHRLISYYMCYVWSLCVSGKKNLWPCPFLTLFTWNEFRSSACPVKLDTFVIG